MNDFNRDQLQEIKAQIASGGAVVAGRAPYQSFVITNEWGATAVPSTVAYNGLYL